MTCEFLLIIEERKTKNCLNASLAEKALLAKSNSDSQGWEGRLLLQEIGVNQVSGYVMPEQRGHLNLQKTMACQVRKINPGAFASARNTHSSNSSFGTLVSSFATSTV
jgi:hypothetical protein